MSKSIKLLFSVLIVVLVVAAYLVANNTAPATNPILKDWVGISLHALSESEAQIVNAGGARWIRTDISPEIDMAIKNAKAYDLKVLGILDSWMFNKNSNFTLEEWSGNVTHYVSQYADYVDAWEIWNEPANPKYPLLNLNLPSQENMSKIVEFYFSMVKTASPIIREYDPTAKIVLFGGLNLWSGNAPHLELDMNFSNELADKNIAQYGDAISVHAYPWLTPVEPTVWQRYDEALAYYRELFALEVWVTETGLPIDFEGENAQAQYMHDSLAYFEGKVAKVFWYSLMDNAWEEERFGLIDGETPRLAYYELQKLLAK
jgi:hypothetical protein